MDLHLTPPYAFMLCTETTLPYKLNWILKFSCIVENLPWHARFNENQLASSKAGRGVPKANILSWISC